ncbi:MAG: tRNA (adenosine(37)-N6)-threonylcarbamoyltransferase complex dimerization subunit type 1 TsaB [Patescibacteria group bacterium]
MTLYINTASHDKIIIALRSGAKTVARREFSAPRQQAEKLVPAIAALLRTRRLALADLRQIMVANYGGSFTSLRIGVITANALAYALNIPVVPETGAPKKIKKFGRHSIVEPIYDREPNIGKTQKTMDKGRKGRG